MQADERAGLSDLDVSLATLTYSSEAITPPSMAELRALTRAAQKRNRAFGVTGMLLYDRGRYFQTLEGPPDGLDLVWASIRRDRRHCNIDLLSQHLAPVRMFSDWDMRLLSPNDVRPGQPRVQGPDDLAAHVPEMVALALAADEAGLATLIDSLAAQDWVADALIKHLIEPAARGLGDAWLADHCTEFELMLGLARLQMAGHFLHANPATAGGQPLPRRSILMVPAPGEPHMLGGSLLGDLFNNAHWMVEIDFPDSAQALVMDIKALHPDVIDISLSDAMTRQHALSGLARVVELCRAAEPAGGLIISVGGRIFAEGGASASSVGADHARRSAAGTVAAVTRMMDDRRAH